MKKHPSLIAAGAATLLLVAYSLGMSATSARSQGVLDDNFLIPILGKRWPPNARDMVVLDGRYTRSPNVFHALYKVPQNKYFVLTNIRVDPVSDLAVFQKFQQKELRKFGRVMLGGAQFAWNLSSHHVGIPFFPGSELGFKSPSPGNTTIRYHLRGYLSDR